MQQKLYASSGKTEPKLNANAVSIQSALDKHPGKFSAIGSAPFLEDSAELATANIYFIFNLANKHKLHVDLHLDNNLAEGEDLTDDEKRAGKGAMIWEVLGMVKKGIMGVQTKTVDGEERTLAIGHGIRLSLFSHEALQRLQHEILSLRRYTRVYLVALPPCDVYCKGRNLGGAYDQCRATLNVVKLTQTYGSVGTVKRGNYEMGLEIALAVGNVQNDFAPQGNADPLELCPIGVMLYQAGLRVTGGEEPSDDDARILLVSPVPRYKHYRIRFINSTILKSHRTSFKRLNRSLLP
jgi:hypothetical protein